MYYICYIAAEMNTQHLYDVAMKGEYTQSNQHINPVFQQLPLPHPPRPHTYALMVRKISNVCIRGFV